MEAFITSALSVTLAEMGDKTQLLSLTLGARFKNKTAIILAITAATLINHGASAWFGQWLSALLQSHTTILVIGISFLILAAWLLIPDKPTKNTNLQAPFGVFLMTLGLFFFAEIGDKTQIATILLAAQFHSIFEVTLGTTLGMLIANIPAVFAGSYLLTKIPLTITRLLASGVFALVGLGIIARGI